MARIEYTRGMSTRDLVYLSGYFSQVREGLEAVGEEFSDTEVARALDGEPGRTTVSRVLRALEDSEEPVIHNGGHIIGGVGMYEKNGYTPEVGDDIEEELEFRRQEDLI